MSTFKSHYFRKKRNDGSVLIVTLALLILMTIISVLFLSISRKESQTSQRATMKVRARLLAHAGLEKANEIIRNNRFDEDFQFSTYNSTGEGGTYLDNLNIDDPGNIPGIPSDYVESPQKIDPKYAKEPTGSQGTIPVEFYDSTIQLGYSGELPSSIPGGHDTYSLKISDNSTKIVVDGTNTHLKTAINYLYEELTGDSSKKPGTKIEEEAIGPGELSSVRELCCNILERETFQILSPYLTIRKHTWKDRSVIAPRPHSDGQETNTRTNDARDPDHLLPYKFYNYKSSSRAPVNINRTKKPVLTALIRGIKARPLVVNKINNDSNAKAEQQFATIGPITRTEARSISQKIVDYREDGSFTYKGKLYEGPFQSWQEFEHFVNSELVDGVISQEKGYLMKAHFNPNTRFGKFNFDENATWSWKQGSDKRFFLDKTDFVYHTTEFVFHSTGYFTVKSYGRVTGKENIIFGEASLRSVVQNFQIVKHTTQQDFLLHSEASTPETNLSFLPESVSDTTYSVDATTKHASYSGKNTGSNLSGRFGFQHTSSSSVDYERWQPSKLSEFLSSTDLIKRISDNHPEEDDDDLDREGWTLRTFEKDAEENEEGNRYGLIPNQELADRENFPDADLLPYSDVTGEGFLISSDRGRVIRFNTPSLDRSESWRNGHLEFWWKPKTAIALGDESFTDNQYKSRGEQLILVEMLFLTDEDGNINIQVPQYTNSEFKYLNSGNNTFMSYLEPEEMGLSPDNLTGSTTNVNFIEKSLPGISGYNNFDPDEEGNFAGYYLKFWLQDGSWHFLVRFRSFFDPDINSDSSPPTFQHHAALDADDLLSGATLAKASYSEVHPEIREWNRVILDWRPQTYKKQFIGGNCGSGNDKGICAQEKKIKLLTGRFSINDQTDTEINSWGEGEILGNRLAISNFLEAISINGDKTIGYVPGGWPLAWYQQDDKWLYFPTIVGPKRLHEYRSFGHIGGIIRKRGSKLNSHFNLEPEVNHKEYWQSYAEGTIDDIYFGPSKGANDKQGPKPIPVLSNRYTKSDSEYKGRIYSRNSNQFTTKLEKYNTTIPQRTLKQKSFSGQTNTPVKIIGISFTQYEPYTTRNGISLGQNERPFFCLKSIKTHSKTYKRNCSNPEAARTGILTKPESKRLFDLSDPVKINVDDINKRYLKYKFKGTANITMGNKWNVTPYIEDVKVLYETPGDDIIDIHFYTPSEEF